ncbi:uncharacterized protein LOC124943705 [Impatiens glandulifera]|uniref:uncharacterized protein LOC124943705 n=1 Tax=Impatiens glandulifera TaxID=253017 RepID=UPI001FB15B0A|nr:uncharacterized protein LOC124943705 [Impatiens glandulifera]
MEYRRQWEAGLKENMKVTLITWQFIYYVSGTTKSSRGLKHQDTVQTIVQTIEGDDVIDCVNINNQLASNHRPKDDNTKDLERDGYNTTGCYDHDCAGFVQIDFSIQLGQPIFPSTLGGQLTFLTIMVYKDDGEDGHWWLYVNGILIGYFPKNLFTSLSEYADRVDFGGEILNKENEGHHTTTQMGNGLYAHENGTSTVSEIKVYDQYRNPVEELHEVFITDSPCYGLLVFGNSICYGGSGYSEICP